MTVSGGSHDTRGFRAIGGGRFGDVKVVGAFEYRETDQDEPFIEKDLQTNLDAIMGTRASLAPSKANTHRQEFGAHLNLTGEHTSFGARVSGWRGIGMGTGTAGVLDPFGSVDSTTWEATLKHWRSIAGNLSFEGVAEGLLLDYKIDDWHFFPPGAFGLFPEGVIFNNEFDQRFLRLRGTLEYMGFANHYWTFGGGVVKAPISI